MDFYFSLWITSAVNITQIMMSLGYTNMIFLPQMSSSSLLVDVPDTLLDHTHCIYLSPNALLYLSRENMKNIMCQQNRSDQATSFKQMFYQSVFLLIISCTYQQKNHHRTSLFFFLNVHLSNIYTVPFFFFLILIPLQRAGNQLVLINI